MSDFTRVTVVGSRRRAVVVVPNDEAVATLVPQLMDLLDEPAGRVARPLVLTRLTGEQLDPDRSPADLAVADGELLRLVRLDEAPPPPEVSDVTDAVSESLADRAGRWDDRSRLVGGSVAVAGLLAAAGLEAAAVPGPTALLPAAVWIAAVLAAAITGLVGRRGAAALLLAAALGLAPAVAIAASTALAGLLPDRLPGLVLLLEAVLWTSLLVGRGAGGHDRAAAIGALAGLLGALLPLGLLAARIPLPLAGAVTAVMATIALGVLPAVAMNASGLSAIDDRVIAGRLTGREEVLVTLAGAYRSLDWTTVAVAVVLGPALAATVQRNDGWLVAFAVAAGLVAALRTRAFPLRVQVVALWAAILLPVVTGALALLVPVAATCTLAGAALVVALLVTARPPAHRRARLRRIGSTIEALAVVALVPLLLGAFGVYGQLLEAFR